MGGDFPEDTLPQASGKARHDLRAVIEAVLRYLNEPATFRAAMPALMAEMQTRQTVAARSTAVRRTFELHWTPLSKTAIETEERPSTLATWQDSAPSPS